MKNLIYLVMIAVLASFSTPKEKIILSGKITNTEDGKIKIKGESYEKEVSLKTDGTFSETLAIEYQGSYIISTKNNRTAIYLGKDTKMNITADDKNFNQTINFSGKGSIENNYILQKVKIINAIKDEEFYKLEENDFLKKLTETKIYVLTLFNKTKFSSSFYKEMEAKNITYYEQLSLLRFPIYHAHYAKIEGYKTTDNFPKIDSSINTDNEADYLFSSNYKNFITSKFDNNIQSQLKENEEFTYKLAVPEIKKIKSSFIKNAFVQNLSYEVGAGNPEAALLYNELIALSTDTKFKENLTKKFEKIKTLTPGNSSPLFDYENFKGGKTSLESLKGKYVYIDVWATWCGPCRKEIPSLQKVEEQYLGKNIEFVSLSIDAKKDYEKWKKFVDEKKLGGIQLFADNDWTSKFVTDYAIEGIPRFILVDPSGKIISADAPRPSDPKLIIKFKELEIK